VLAVWAHAGQFAQQPQRSFGHTGHLLTPLHQWATAATNEQRDVLHLLSYSSNSHPKHTTKPYTS
jgi:hypothetical protein